MPLFLAGFLLLIIPGQMVLDGRQFGTGMVQPPASTWPRSAGWTRSTGWTRSAGGPAQVVWHHACLGYIHAHPQFRGKVEGHLLKGYLPSWYAQTQRWESLYDGQTLATWDGQGGLLPEDLGAASGNDPGAGVVRDGKVLPGNMPVPAGVPEGAVCYLTWVGGQVQ